MSEAPKRRSTDELAAALRSGDRSALSRAITLVESAREQDRPEAQRLLELVLPHTGGAARVGVTGVPGAGKSTFIDALGGLLCAEGRRVAVLAVDPSSEASGGSILGDKTRMERLAREPRAFIRPSPASDGAGGVAPRTREVALLCEAAGYDVVLIETVGSGQSDLAVAHMVDTLVLLALAGAGDELQGIKRGIMELVDVIALHKADQGERAHLERARADLGAAQRILHPGGAEWRPPVVECSARTGAGIAEVWEAVQQHRAFLGAEGIAGKRRAQAVHWFEDCVAERLRRELTADPETARALSELRAKVRAGELPPRAAAAELWQRRQGG